ncbi:DUF2157 domain-containing protein [Actinomadura bangladeshensis]|uniref:DUF2157 domain-containing protein n=1 Tax=Actinomadura bangladeshensis TaxID=453573 RepID=A0A4R4P4X9_9ACTN|nr:DUF2157 domain-containing protein [Actinomadura bangladeshensis]
METAHIPPRRLLWLRGEVAAWQAEGLIDGETAARIASRYTDSRRFALERLVLFLGSAFVGVGLIWTVAANYEELSPMVRFAGIVVIWLAAVVGAELLASRVSGALPAAARVIAVAAGGGTVFQTAQSLQVPAGSSSLLGAWAGGALAYAYATRGRAPLLVAAGLSVGWYAWWAAENAGSHGVVVCAMLVAAGLATGLAELHERWTPAFADVWRPVGVLLALVGLYIAAFPDRDFRMTNALWAGVALTVLVSAVAVWLGSARGQVAAMLGILAAGVLLALWDPAGSMASPSGEALVRAIAGIVCYVLAAAWFAVLGTSRELPGIVPLAAGALVIFVTTQSFAVFAPLFSGAALFLVLGAVFLGTGVLAYRGRRLITKVVS